MVPPSCNLHEDAWVLKESNALGVRVAPWTIEKGKKDFHRGLVGFLSLNRDCIC